MFGYNKESFTDAKAIEKFKNHLDKGEEKFFYCVGSHQKGVFGGAQTYFIVLTKSRFLIMEVDMKTWEEKTFAALPFSEIESMEVKRTKMGLGNIPLPGFIVDLIVDHFFTALKVSKFIIQPKNGEKYKIQCSEGIKVYGFKMGLEGQEKGVAKINEFVDHFDEHKKGLSDSFFA